MVVRGALEGKLGVIIFFNLKSHFALCLLLKAYIFLSLVVFKNGARGLHC
jgi:hypothetical protein